MVGMQASLHTSISENESSRMGNLELMGSQGDNFLQGNRASGSEEEFDPDELLKSPLFNDSANRISLSQSSLNFMSDDNIRIDEPMEKDQLHQVTQHEDVSIAAVDTAVGKLPSTSHFESALSPLKPMPTVNPSSETDFFVQNVLQSPLGNGAPNASSQGNQTGSIFGGGFPVDNRNPVQPSMAPKMRHIPNRSASAGILPSQGMNDLRQMQQMQPAYAADDLTPNPIFASPERRAAPPRSLSQNAVLPGNSFNQLQQMQPLRGQETAANQFQLMQNRGQMGLSQSLHMTSQQVMGNGDRAGLSHSSHGDTLLNGGSTFRQEGSFSFTSRQQQPQGHSPNKAPPSLNEAMEKLCGSMKRSAMSRSMVKQFSGRNMNRQGSLRSINRQGSDRSLIGDSGIARRSSGVKHQLQHPSRGVYRHDSQQSLGQSGHGGGMMQLDGLPGATF